MNKAGHILSFCLLLLELTASAQRYERVIRDNFWNGSANVAGIRQDTVSRSYAEAFGRYEGGEFRDTWQASRGWSAGAATASIRHMERISLKGSFSFEQSEGYGMCGSMFIKPGFYPVDVLEFTPGHKTLQTYAFDGGISYDVAPKWRIGARMDFESANLAKRKDLRHTNWLLDMTIAPGIMYHDGNLALGMSYIFRKTSESIKAEQLGIAGSSYYAFLDKGMMYGVHSVWSGSGIHLAEAGVNMFPVKDISNGAAVQMQYKGLFAEARYLRKHGTVGEKEYIWFRFPGNEVGATLGYIHNGHRAKVDFGWKGLKMDESILEKVTENGVTTVLDHGSNRILAQQTARLSPEYEYITEASELRIGADFNWKNSLSSQMYPYIYSQKTRVWKAYAEALFHTGSFDLGLSAGLGKGSVHEDRALVSETTGVQTQPYRLEEWYGRQMEFITAAHLDADMSLRYNFSKGIYLEAEGGWMHGFGLKHLAGADRITATLRLGYDF